MTCVASKSLISPATLLPTRDGSNIVMRVIPLRPLTSPSQNVSTSLPSGVMAPMPVTATRRRGCSRRPSVRSAIDPASADRLVARDDERQLRLDGKLAVDARHGVRLPEHALQLLDGNLEAQRVARDDRPPEAALGDW